MALLTLTDEYSATVLLIYTWPCIIPAYIPFMCQLSKYLVRLHNFFPISFLIRALHTFSQELDSYWLCLYCFRLTN